MKRTLQFCITLGLICAALNPAESQQKDAQPQLDWSTVFIQTPQGFIQISKFEKAAWQHLEKSDINFTNIVSKSAWVIPNATAEVSIIYSQGLGKWGWTVCLDSNQNVINVWKRVMRDYVAAVGEEAAASPLAKSLCK